MATSSGMTLSGTKTPVNATTFCTPLTRVNSKGIFYGENPLQFSLPLALLQLGLVNTIISCLQVLLKPFGQPRFVSQILGALLLGPSFLGHIDKFSKAVFPLRSTMLLDIYELFGFTFFTFLMGVKIEAGGMAGCGKLPFVIGFGAFFVPVLVTGYLAHLLVPNVKFDKELQKSLPIVAFLESMTSFHMTSSMLGDLKLLNSEVGRVALSSAKISGLFSWLFLIIANCFTMSSNAGAAFAGVLSRVTLLFIIFFIFRPFMLYMIRKTPEGKPLRESYVCLIIVMLMVCALLGDAGGFHTLFGTIALGVAVPVGPPLGSGLVDKLDCFISTVLLPFYLINVGRNVDLFHVRLASFGVLESVVLCATFCKIIAVLGPALFHNMAFLDALSLGLLMSCQGFFDIQFFSWALSLKMIDIESFTIMVIMAMLHSAVFIPIAGYLYDPSRRYLGYKRTIQQSGHSGEFRILVCVYEEENVPSLVNILEVSNPTRESPMAVYVMELVKLVGRSSPVLITHQNTQIKTSKPNKIDRIVNAFYLYERKKGDITTMQCFTAIAPYASMHDDICTMALEKCTSLVVIPFRRYSRLQVRSINKLVLNKAPCSIAILVDKGFEAHSAFARAQKFNVCIIFLGGPDDREVLSFGVRMAENLNVSLDLIQISEAGYDTDDVNEATTDADAISEFRMVTAGNKRVSCIKETVKEASKMVKVLGAIDTNYDLILVGRSHEDESPLLRGLSDWCEIEELGVIGDMLASPEFKSNASILVVQQQAAVKDPWIPNSRSVSMRGFER